jgi:hypothetical protein
MRMQHHSYDTQFLDSGLQGGAEEARIRRRTTLVRHYHPQVLDNLPYIRWPVFSVRRDAKWDDGRSISSAHAHFITQFGRTVDFVHGASSTGWRGHIRRYVTPSFWGLEGKDGLQATSREEP